MSKHTPGPWLLNQTSGATHKVFGGPHICDINGDEIAWPCFGSADTNDAANANAKLIAAAPELLSALKRTLDLAVGHACEARGIDGSECETWSWVKRARAAIAQAGENE